MNITIKPTYLLIVAALALASCSDNDDLPVAIEYGSNQIHFVPSVPTSVTSRATIITAENIPYFNVTAFDCFDNSPLFDNKKVDVAGRTAPFTSPDCRWPDPGKEDHLVTFFSFYPALKEGDGSAIVSEYDKDNITYTLSGFKVKPDIDKQDDFVTAIGTGSMTVNQFSGIELPFEHQLNRIEVKAWSGHKSCDIEIAGVRIGGIYTKGDYTFRRTNVGNYCFWIPNSFSDKNVVEYIFSKGDKIITLAKGAPATSKDTGALSIMGNIHPDGNNAMLIPANYDTAWDFATDPNNEKGGLYISVLLRVIDATLTAGVNPVEKQRYPYKDLSQGADSYMIPKEYFAINKTTGEVSAHIYKNENGYFTDSKCTAPYTLQASDEIKEFGWAAVPVTGTWESGKIYTYTLNYSEGVGLHDPSVTTTAPAAGDAVISDKVGITYTVTEWKAGGGSSFVVPGS